MTIKELIKDAELNFIQIIKDYKEGNLEPDALMELLDEVCTDLKNEIYDEVIK